MVAARTMLASRYSPGGIFSIVNVADNPGDVYFVGSTMAGAGDAAGNGGSPDTPFATIAYAIAQCTANQGDAIIVLPGHAETVAAATALAFSKAGVSVIGLGRGTLRPTITLAGTDSTIAVSAANVSFRNLVIKVSIDEVVVCFNVTAAFCTLDAVDFIETAAKQLISFLKTSAAGTDLVIQNCRHHQSTAPAANSLWIQLIGADRAKILDNVIQITTTNNASSSVVESDTTAPVNILIARNIFVQLGGTATVPIKLMAATSGFVHDNKVASAKTAIAGSIALASCYGANNYAGHVVNTNGLLEPVVDT